MVDETEWGPRVQRLDLDHRLLSWPTLGGEGRNCFSFCILFVKWARWTKTCPMPLPDLELTSEGVAVPGEPG